MQVDPATFSGFLRQASFKSNGDWYEQEFGHYLSERFPDCERFWQSFIVPLTRRVEGYPDKLTSDIRFRQSIAPELEDIASVHYSIFVNLIYAHRHLETQTLSFLEDTYVHLASACDLIETVLEKWYLLLLACQGGESHLLQKLSREEFLEKAGDWYDENYSSFCDYYLSKGKSPPINLLSVKGNLLKEYLGNSSERKAYARHSQSVRQFRNVIVHDVRVGKIATLDGQVFVPKPKEIQRYRSWRQVTAIADNVDIIREHFAEPYQQSQEDLETLESLTNRLWDRMIDEFENEFYSAERLTLRKMFGIEFSPDASMTVPPGEEITVSTKSHVSASGVYSGRLSDFSHPDDEP